MCLYFMEKTKVTFWPAQYYKHCVYYNTVM